MSNISYEGFCSVFNCRDISPVEPIGNMQAREASVLLAMSRFFKPKRYMELGVAQGATAALLLRHSPWLCEYVGIDAKPNGILPTYDEKTVYPLPNAGFKCVDPRFKMYLREAGRPDPALLNGSFDMIFVDSDHTYEGISHDTPVAEAVLSCTGGVILWHDYGYPGVSKFLNARNQKAPWPQPVCLVEGTSICFEIRGYG